MPNRREFLRNVAGASAGVLFLGHGLDNAAEPSSQAGAVPKRREVMVGKRRVKTVDVHAHVAVPEVTDLLKGTPLERRTGNLPGNFDARGLAPARLQRMDEEGIDVQALSINSFWYSADRDLASRVVKLQNEKLAAMCATHPDRFVAFASVALQFPELAAQQLEEGMKRWGLRGAAIGGTVEGQDQELSSPKFDPFWAKAEELQALIFMHPQDSANATGIRARVRGRWRPEQRNWQSARNDHFPVAHDFRRNPGSVSQLEDLRGPWRRLPAVLCRSHGPWVRGLPRPMQKDPQEET